MQALNNAISEMSFINQFMKGLPDGPVPFHVPAPDYRTQLLERDP